MRKHGVEVDVIRFVDHDIATGVWPDMREHGWETDAWPEPVAASSPATSWWSAGPIWLGDNSSEPQEADRAHLHALRRAQREGQVPLLRPRRRLHHHRQRGRHQHCAQNVLYSLQHVGYTIPPNADAGWIGEAGPGPSYLDPGSGGPENDFTSRNTTFMTWNLMHLATMLKDAGACPGTATSARSGTRAPASTGRTPSTGRDRPGGTRRCARALLRLAGPRVRVLLTGAAGFIGGAIRRTLAAAGHDLVLVDVLLPQAHRVPPSVEGLHVLDVRDAAESADLLDGVDVVCHQAALVGAGTTVSDLPAYAAHNDLGTAALLAAMAARDVRRLVLASSMVVYGEGRYACSEHGVVAPPPRSVTALEDCDFDNHCPACGRALGWELVEESARLDPRSSYAAGKVAQEHYTSAWARQADSAAVALRYHNVYGPGMPGTRRTPVSPRSSGPRWNAVRRRGSSRTGGRYVTSCTSTTSPAPTSPP